MRARGDVRHVKGRVRAERPRAGSAVRSAVLAAGGPALDAVVAKFEQRGIHAELVGMNEHAERLHTRTTGNVTVH